MAQPQSNPVKPPVIAEFREGNLGREKGFGRLVATDLRDHQYLMRDAIRQLVPRRAPVLMTKAWDVVKEPGIPTDQGPTPRCGEFSMRNLLGIGPVKNRVSDLPPEGQIYDMCQAQDAADYGWQLPFDGTTTRSVMKVGQKLGYWGEYRWSFHFDDTVKMFLQSVGPMICGTIWPDSFMSPIKRGNDYWLDLDLNNPTMFGPHAAGHLWCTFAIYPNKVHPVSKVKGAIKMLQSWGKGWGDPTPDGTALIDFKTFDTIVAEGGELAMPLEKKLK